MVVVDEQFVILKDGDSKNPIWSNLTGRPLGLEPRYKMATLSMVHFSPAVF